MRNHLLRLLPAEDFERLRPHLTRVPTTLRQMLIAPDVPVTHLFFPESGFVSLTTMTSGREVEVGLVGPEGLAGAMPILLGSDSTPYVHYVQSAGEVLRIDVGALSSALDESPPLRARLLRFVQVLWVQTAQTAYVNATFVIEHRLARWLLMCQDRLGGSELAVTHEFLAIMLAVQRTSVTLALQVLEGERLIKARRGRIVVADRAGLLTLAGKGYGVPEREYERLIGQQRLHPEPHADHLSPA